MPRSRRAKQFQPFDALRGLKEAIAAKEKITVPKRELSEDSIAEINKTLIGLEKGQIVTIVYYGTYEQNYLQLTGPVTKVDTYWHHIEIGHVAIDFTEIFQILTDIQAQCLLPE